MSEYSICRLCRCRQQSCHDFEKGNPVRPAMRGSEKEDAVGGGNNASKVMRITLRILEMANGECLLVLQTDSSVTVLGLLF